MRAFPTRRKLSPFYMVSECKLRKTSERDSQFFNTWIFCIAKIPQKSSEHQHKRQKLPRI